MLFSRNVKDSRLNPNKIFAPLPVTADDARFEKDLSLYVNNQLYIAANNKKVTDSVEKLLILKEQFRLLKKKPQSKALSEYEKVLAEFIQVKTNGRHQYEGMIKRDPHFVEDCMYYFEKILYLTVINPEVKGRLDRLGKDLSSCGPGLKTKLQDIVYELTKKPGFENWLPDYRRMILESLASIYALERRKKMARKLKIHERSEQNEIGVSYEIHFELWCYKYAEALDFQLPNNRAYANTPEIYKVSHVIADCPQKRFKKDFLEAYNYDAILAEVTARYRDLLVVYRNRDLAETSSEEAAEAYIAFMKVIEPFLRYNVFKIEDIFESSEDRKKIKEDFFSSLPCFCEALLYSEGYFAKHPAYSLSEDIMSDYLQKKYFGWMRTRPKNHIRQVIRDISDITETDTNRISLQEKMELQFFFIQKKIKEIQKSYNWFQRLRRKYFGFKKDSEKVLEAKYKEYEKKKLGQFSEDRCNEVVKVFETVTLLKKNCQKIRIEYPNLSAEEQNNLATLEKHITQPKVESELTLSHLEKYKEHFSVLIKLHSNYLESENIVKCFSLLKPTDLTDNNLITLFNKATLQPTGSNWDEVSFAIRFLQLQNDISKRNAVLKSQKKEPAPALNPQDFLLLPENYLIPPLIDVLPRAWFSSDNIQLLKLLLEKFEEGQEVNVINLIASHNLSDYTQDIRGTITAISDKKLTVSQFNNLWKVNICEEKQVETNLHKVESVDNCKSTSVARVLEQFFPSFMQGKNTTSTKPTIDADVDKAIAETIKKYEAKGQEGKEHAADFRFLQSLILLEKSPEISRLPDEDIKRLEKVKAFCQEKIAYHLNPKTTNSGEPQKRFLPPLIAISGFYSVSVQKDHKARAEHYDLLFKACERILNRQTNAKIVCP